MLNHLRLRARRFLSHFYAVPWCVPQWGWREFALSARCLVSGQVTRGPYAQTFADAVKDHLGLPYAFAVNRGRVAVELVLRALGLGAGDDVVLPSYVCGSLVEGVLRAGTRPVFADIGPDLHVSVETVKAAMTPRTKCVIVPHLFGNAAPIDGIESFLSGTGVWLIDDAAQSFGAVCAGRPIGTFGVCGIICCGPGKTLAGPAGGLIVTRDRELWERVAAASLDPESAAAVLRRVASFWVWRRFRRWTLPLRILLNLLVGPEEEKAEYTRCPLSNLEGRLGFQQLQAFRKNLVERRQNAQILLQALGGLARHSISDVSASGALVKLVLVLDREGPGADEVVRLLARAGIECQKGYVPCHLAFPEGAPDLPNTNELWNRVVCIPVETPWKAGRRELLPASELARPANPAG